MVAMRTLEVISDEFNVVRICNTETSYSHRNIYNAIHLSILQLQAIKFCWLECGAFLWSSVYKINTQIDQVNWILLFNY